MIRLYLTLLSIFFFLSIYGQEEQKGIVLSGSVQSDMLIPKNDEEIGALKEEDFLTNTYATLHLQSRHIDAGVRLEYMEHPLPGFEKDFKGWGVPHFYAKYKTKIGDFTLGTFYEEFGSGFILRSYEERSLGIDNSLLGFKTVLRPMRGLTLKALTGRQRRYWDWNKSWISGADLEMNIEEFIPSLSKGGTHMLLGASWVNKYNRDKTDVFTDATHKVNFPRYVNAWDLRANVNHGPWNVLAEYAQKTDDPSFDNGYIFHRGSAAMLSLSYSSNGLSGLFQAKRSENISFKSVVDPSKSLGISSSINHLPSFTQDHTYALTSLYPYATQMSDGEWAFQGELSYKFKRKTPIGGKYGMQVKLNFSHVRGIPHNFVDGTHSTTLPRGLVLAGTGGYSSPFFKFGDETYYQDFNINVSRRLSNSFSLNLTYMNQLYNQTIIEGHGGKVNSNIFVAEGKYKISPKTTLRGELQYLTTPDDQGDWAYGLLELSLVPHWMFSVSDMYNAGSTHNHYYQCYLTYNRGAHRIQAGYGRTRAGYNCSGGVCRYVPSSSGLTLSYNYNF